MKHFTLKWFKRFSVLIAVKLFIFAALLTTARIFFVSVGDYKEQVASWLVEEYSVKFSVEDISASVDFSGLVVTLNQLQLPNSKGLPFTLKLDHLFLHLNFWDSIFERRLNFNRISLQGADLTLKSNISDTDPADKPSLTVRTLENIFLNQLKRFSISNSRLHFYDHFGVKKTVFIEELRWVNSGKLHQGVGRAKTSDAPNEDALQFVLNLSGEVENTEKDLQGELYVAANNLNINNYLSGKIDPSATLLDARIGFQAWLSFSDKRLESLQVRLRPSQLSWQQFSQTQDWQLNSGYLQLTNSRQGWRFDSYDVQIKQNNNADSTLSFSGTGDNSNVAMQVKGVTLAKALPFYLLFNPPAKEQALKLKDIALDANLDEFKLQKKASEKRQFFVHLSAFKNKAKGAIPGLSNAEISLSGDVDNGLLSIQLPTQKVYFDGLFSRAMPITSGLIDVYWQQTPKGLKLFSDNIVLNTTDIESKSEFSLFIPNKKAHNQQVFLSLYSYASLNDASKVQYYYPIKAIGEGVFNYLAPTLKKGHVQGAKILWYGALSAYPFRKKEGIFQAWVPVRDAQYDFYGKWPGLTDLDLDLFFENASLTMTAKRASLGDLSIRKLSGYVDTLSPKGSLIILADIRDDAKKIHNYLNISPLKSTVGKALDIINVQKEVSGQLKISIPFSREKHKTRIEGVVQLKDNDIDFVFGSDLNIPLRHVNGEFSFVDAELQASNIEATLYNEALQLAFSSTQSATHYDVKADLGGSWSLDRLSEKTSWLPVLKASGEIEWQGDVNFSYAYNSGYDYQVNLKSETQGVRILLPAPYHKNALQSWPVSVALAGDQQESNIVFKIKHKLALYGALNYTNKTPKITYLQLNLGQKDIPLLVKNQQAVHLQFDNIVLTPWFNYWRQLKVDLPQLFAKKKNESLVNIKKISAKIKRISLFEQPLFALNIQAFKKMTAGQDVWYANIFSNDLQGKLEYRDGLPARIDVVLDKLNLQSLDLSTYQSGTTSGNFITDYPELFVQCLDCRYKQIDLSPLSLHIYPTKNLLNINKMDIGKGQEITKISGVWDRHKTTLSIKSTANREGDLVKRFGFSSPLVANDALLEGSLNWIGAPWQFNLKTLNGDFRADFNDGSITKVSDKGARLLSILSLDGIRRSLNMEFGDVFAKGFSFDDMNLSATITNGIIKNDDFYLNGSAGKLTGGGLIDLPNFDTNYHLSYSPAVTSSLPLLTAFAINPLTGAAVLLLTKILEPVVDAIVRIDFSVKGALNDPVVSILSRQKGKVKLQNSAALEAIQLQNIERQKEKGTQKNQESKK
ncbi:hypothetical protein PCNPT3_03385 [Psychromonas sp. CNPT3]|uniref:YhdP family protein n=1 Tax=Psychromonas sp. CNPT3 TaxID=314282 RepID=UPI0002C13738|nr:YhdP family protein [Psychromonas sp. CNPT3]AGH80619.1 hypothetical protein PCNPT3_03385 [Psychromonas sp. CNPT3]